jgi:hypothetical protein
MASQRDAAVTVSATMTSQRDAAVMVRVEYRSHMLFSYLYVF